MTVSPGTQLGPYEITAPIGKGGMGEVWKARDTRLGRDVAIKISSEQFTERFEREARAIAALNHPNICHLYDVGPNYLVMELVEGTPLKGPLPVEKAVEYSGQILDALDAAHRKGITHRDLKPANILVTKQGIKLLDFGLAKQAVGLGEDDPTKALTDQGQIIGTLQYMSPEQLQGKEADARSDLFSFGCVLYEMLSGKRAFEGQSSASVIAAILEREPPKLEAVPSLDRVVRRSLAKDPDQRFQTARDLKAALNWALEQPAVSSAAAHKPSRRWWIAAITAVLLAALSAIAVAHFIQPSAIPSVAKFAILAPEKIRFRENNVPAVSPDGHHLAFTARVSLSGNTFLWVRDLDSLDPRLLSGTDGASFPFWSPDSRYIGFFGGGKLKKIDVSGGPALSLCDAPNGFGGSWNKDNVIVFAPNSTSGLFRVAAAGGSVTPVTALDAASSESSHRFPWFLPDGLHFLYTVGSRNGESRIGIHVSDLDSKVNSGNERVLVTANSNAVYSPPGYVLFVRERTLMAQPFDLGKRSTTGDAMPVAQQVDAFSDPNSSVAQFSSSQNGVLAYASGGASGYAQLTWFDRSGKPLGTVGTPGFLQRPVISPDGRTVAVDRRDPQTGLWDLWLHDLARGTASRFTANSQNNTYPVWSPDGSHIAFSSNRDGGPRSNVYQKAASGALQDEALDKDARNKIVVDWSRNGRYIIEVVVDPKTKRDIWVLPLFGERKPFPFLQTAFEERNAKLSPDGQWLAYTSDETNRDEVYVQTFPNHGGKWQISTNGGGYPIWSWDGKELFFLDADRKLMAVAVKGRSAGFEASVPRPLFDTRFLGLATSWFDVSKDGKFLIPTEVEQGSGGSISVVVNWTAGLKK